MSSRGTREELLAKQKARQLATVAPSPVLQWLEKNYKLAAQVAVAILAVCFSLYVWKEGSSGVQNLVGASDATLKSVLLGDKPYLFYCHRGSVGKGSEVAPPPLFTSLKSMKGLKDVGFGILDCSQVMPSGKSIQERFKLKKEWRPIMFAAAPWMKPKQIPPPQMKDVATLRKYVAQALAPRATEVATDKELRAHCGIGRNITHDDRSVGDTCIVLLKGKRHSKKQTELEEWLIKAFPRVKMASVDAQKRRLSFEDAAALPAQDFALKVHALRNGTHSLTMVNPVTWDYLSTFVSHAAGTPLFSYDGDGSERISLVKTGAGPTSSFKDRSAKFQQQQQQQQQQQGGGSSSGSKRRARSSSQTNTGEDSAGSKAEAPPPPEETEAERLVREAAREARRREQMERQAKESVFESVESAGGDGGSEEEEEDLIEL